VAYCTVITAFSLRARGTLFRGVTVQQRQTQCYWDSYREADPRIGERANATPLSHRETYGRNNPALVPSGGDCILSHHPSPAVSGFFPLAVATAVQESIGYLETHS